MKTLALITLIMLTGAGGVPAQNLSDSAIKTAITKALRSRPPWEMIAGGAIGIPANVQAQSVTIVRRGPYNSQRGYWPIQATVSGTFDKRYHDGTSKQCTFAGTTDFQIYKNDYGDWLARATYAAETQLKPDCSGSGSQPSIRSSGSAAYEPLPKTNLHLTTNRKTFKSWRVILPRGGWFDTGIIVGPVVTTHNISVATYPVNRQQKHLRWDLLMNGQIWVVELDGSGFPTNGVSFNSKFLNPRERVYKLSLGFKESLKLKNNMGEPIVLQVDVVY
jgi:hypothetical protein